MAAHLAAPNISRLELAIDLLRPTRRSDLSAQPGPSLRVRAISTAVVVAVTAHTGKRGEWRIVRWITNGAKGDVTVTVADQANITFPASDPYWFRLVARSYEYEPEVHVVLDLLRNVDILFIDAGANIGYWSALASTLLAPESTVVAIEPNPSLLQYTRRNSAQAQSFVVLDKAVFSEDDTEMTFVAGDLSHAGGHLSTVLQSNAKSQREVVVTTITVDTVASSYANGRPVLLKLDVEGAEIPTLEGSTATLRGETAVLYEDHGRDRQSTVSQWLLDRGYQIFYLNRTGVTSRVRDLDDLSGIKRQTGIGYNFLAIKPGSSWESLLHLPI